ncbi:hypothetical protein U0070_014869, partial [Myodes glareolus]
IRNDERKSLFGNRVFPHRNYRITDHPELKIFLFLLFYVIYLVTMVGNLGLVVLIYMEHCLQKPMYFFLGNLTLMDSCCSCTITPKMLENFFSVDTRISFYECMVQLYFLCLAETADCFLLAAMAYDRYVAICYSLQYHTLMSKKLSIQMSTVMFIANPFINELMIYIFSMPILVFTIITILIFYFCILFTIFKMKSKDGRGKAISTYGSHLLSVSIFCICLLMYVGPLDEGNKDIPYYTMVYKKLCLQMSVATYLTSNLHYMIPVGCLLRGNRQSEMSENNYSMTNEFILLGFLYHPNLKTLLFLVFSAIFKDTMVGNLSLAVLIYMERCLHTP